MSLALVRQQTFARSPVRLPQRRGFAQLARAIADSLHAPIRRVQWADECFVTGADDHADRVAVLAVRFGRTVGLDEVSLASLWLGALLHDEGKARLPEGLLGKQGPLSQQEWVWIHQHPLLGMEVARTRGVEDRNALLTILYHHERWDGLGYPVGLREAAIPPLARIAALCDVFDALRSERPYKAAWSLEETLDYITRQGGSQFDPELSSLFVEFARTTEDPR